MYKKIVIICLVLIYPILVTGQVVQIVYSSDMHYGISRKNFRGDTSVNAHLVNEALIKKMNTLPALIIPKDGGVGAGNKISAVDFLIQTGDVANKMDPPIQTAATSWVQFASDYRHKLTLKDKRHNPTRLLLVPGNHDVTNAIGSSKIMNPATDPTSMVQIYNWMMRPTKLKTNKTYNYITDKVNYSVDVQGIHMVFITLWPDSAERIWMEKDLKKIPKTTPVLIFCHDPPTADPKHFTNPVPPFNMTVENKFENLLSEHYKESNKASKDENATNIEQRGLVRFLKQHPNIKAYFHGHNNHNEFYVYNGPDHDIALNIFRVDSPMKGSISSKDETKLSFQLITMDTKKKKLTVRECLWNTDPANPLAKIVFGDSKTIDLKVNL